MGQVTLAPEKTQLMVTTQAHRPAGTASGITLGGRDLVRQEEIEVLGVKINRYVSFTGHVKDMTKRAAGRLSCVRRISHLLDARAINTLYKSQVRSIMEYAPLTWCSCPPSYLGLLDKVQRRAQRLMDLHTRLHETPSLLQPLQHRRDV